MCSSDLDIRDLEYDRVVNPGRPLPSGLVRQRDLAALVAAGSALLLLLNAARGGALVMLVIAMGYTALVIGLELRAGWPHRDRLVLQVAVNLPILTLFSLYVYAGFLRAEHLRPSPVGPAAVLAVTLAALAMELGRKTTRRPRPGERTYVTLLGASGTSYAALAAAAGGTGIVLVALTPWRGRKSGG